VIAPVGKLTDPRAAEALDIVERKRRPDGLWASEGHFWKDPGKTGSNVEVVDWVAEGRTR
jgi:hypothetical protein